MVGGEARLGARRVRAVRKRESTSDRVFTIVNGAFLGTVLVVTAYPLLFVLASSLSSADAVLSSRVVIWPVGLNLEGYRAVFLDPRIVRSFVNTIYYTSVGTVINIAMCIAIAYPLSRRDLVGRNVFTFVLAFTMFFNGGLIPTYLLVLRLGLINTIWALVLTDAVVVYHVIITRTYFQSTIPSELLDSAKIDGCGNIRFLLRIVMPLSAPIIAVITLYSAVMHWNTFFKALIYIQEADKHPLQLVLRSILIQNQINIQDEQFIQDLELQARLLRTQAILKYALIVVASVPVLILYPIIQRHFVKGVMIGAIKG